MKSLMGWLAIVLATLSLAPSFVPGAMSLIGLLTSLGALIISLLSITKGKKIYFNITLIIIVTGVLFINDALRVWQPLPMPINAKITMYGIFGLVVLISLFAAKEISEKEKVT